MCQRFTHRRLTLLESVDAYAQACLLDEDISRTTNHRSDVEVLGEHRLAIRDTDSKRVQRTGKFAPRQFHEVKLSLLLQHNAGKRCTSLCQARPFCRKVFDVSYRGGKYWRGEMIAPFFPARSSSGFGGTAYPPRRYENSRPHDRWTVITLRSSSTERVQIRSRTARHTTAACHNINNAARTNPQRGQRDPIMRDPNSADLRQT